MNNFKTLNLGTSLPFTTNHFNQNPDPFWNQDNFNESEQSYPPRCSTPVQLGMSDYHESTHLHRYKGSGAFNHVYLVENRLNHHTECAIKIPKPGKALSAKRDYLRELKIRDHIERQLLPDRLANNHDLIAIMRTFNLSTEVIQSKLILNSHIADSKKMFPGLCVARLPAVENAEDLYSISEQIRDSYRVDHNTKQLMRITFTACRDMFVMLSVLKTLKVLHFDIKPSNIMVNESGEGFIVDYGLSHIVLNDGTTARGGTETYKAPEHFRNEVKSYPSDAYSAGLASNFILCGRRRQIDESVRPRRCVLTKYEIISDTFKSTFSHSAYKTIGNILRGEIDKDHFILHPDPSKRMSAFEAACKFDAICREFKLNKPLSKERYS